MFNNIIELLFVAVLGYDVFASFSLKSELKKAVGGDRNKFLMHLGWAKQRGYKYTEDNIELNLTLTFINFYKIAVLFVIVVSMFTGTYVVPFEALFVIMMVWEYALCKKHPESSLYEQIRNEIKRVIEENNESD